MKLILSFCGLLVRTSARPMFGNYPMLMTTSWGTAFGVSGSWARGHPCLRVWRFSGYTVQSSRWEQRRHGSSPLLFRVISAWCTCRRCEKEETKKEEEQRRRAASCQKGQPAPGSRNEGFPRGSVFDPSKRRVSFTKRRRGRKRQTCLPQIP